MSKYPISKRYILEMIAHHIRTVEEAMATHKALIDRELSYMKSYLLELHNIYEKQAHGKKKLL